MSRWVQLAYRLPREPSTPRITLWRALRRLGVVQVMDGLVALPYDARTREQLEWLADDVVENGGEATIWVAEPATIAQERALAERMSAAVRREYERVAEEARRAAHGDPTAGRTLGRLRRDLRRIRARDYFPSEAADRATSAVEALARRVEVAS